MPMLRRVLWFDFLSTSEDVPQRLTRLCTLTLCLMGTIGCITFILSGPQMHFSLQPLQWLELFFFCIQRQHAERQDFRCYKWINFKDVSENVSEAEVF